ncbi:MAG TPA: DUF177 domain-containing protein [Thermoanaerobaculia bacterium]|jgi:uncharacterized protein|nr:DUF177 domain-containing protein [Thermoanaerobaculia bacterium]
MQIWLEQVREEPLAWKEAVVVALSDFESPDLVAMSPVECSGRMVFAEPGFLLTADLSYEQTLACTRCLTQFVERMEPTIELLVLQGKELVEDEERELGARDLGVWQVEGDKFLTEPVIVEQVQLNIPMKPLCREDCRGLCPTCGADLNAGDCGCDRAVSDPRWSGLAALRGQLGKVESGS